MLSCTLDHLASSQAFPWVAWESNHRSGLTWSLCSTETVHLQMWLLTAFEKFPWQALNSYLIKDMFVMLEYQDIKFLLWPNGISRFKIIIILWLFDPGTAPRKVSGRMINPDCSRNFLTYLELGMLKPGGTRPELGLYPSKIRRGGGGGGLET